VSHGMLDVHSMLCWPDSHCAGGRQLGSTND